MMVVLRSANTETTFSHPKKRNEFRTLHSCTEVSTLFKWLKLQTMLRHPLVYRMNSIIYSEKSGCNKISTLHSFIDPVKVCNSELFQLVIAVKEVFEKKCVKHAKKSVTNSRRCIVSQVSPLRGGFSL